MRRNHSLPPNVLTITVLLGTAIALALTAPTANAEVITVCWDGSGDYLTIQEGIDAAADGDEVVVCDGTYTGPGNKNLDFGGKAITVRSANGPENCIIDCQNDGRGFYFHSGETGGSIVEGLTIANGYCENPSGTAIYCYYASPTIANCAIVGNGGGYAVWCDYSDVTLTGCTVAGNEDGLAGWQSSPTITDCTIDANDGRGLNFEGASCNPAITDCTITANASGGVLAWEGTLTMDNCTIAENTSPYAGGGVACRGPATISDCAIAGNASDEAGGAIYCNSSDATISNCTITGNTAMWSGGGVACGSGSPTIVNCSITANIAGWAGGGIGCFGGSTPTIRDCTIAGNTAYGYHGRGGGIFLDGCAATVADCTVAGNRAASGSGGGVMSESSTLTLSRCTVAGNSAGYVQGDASGGGIYLGGGSAAITDCVVLGNTALSDGGGILLDSSSVAITSCAIVANIALYGGGAGVLCAAGDFAISNCLIAENTAEYFGGGIGSMDAVLTIANCTISRNVARQGGSGGGAVAITQGNASVDNCILWFDSASQGRELSIQDSSALTLSYSLLDGGEAAVYVEDGSALDWGPGNIDADPLFVAFTCGDYRLSPGSPCIDAGCNWSVPADVADLDDDADTTEATPFDLDGEGRFFDDPDTHDTGCGCPPIVDMGAYEFGGTGPQPCPGDLNCDRVVDHSDLGILLAAWHLCADGDLNCDGDTDHADLGILLAHWGDTCE